MNFGIFNQFGHSVRSSTYSRNYNNLVLTGLMANSNLPCHNRNKVHCCYLDIFHLLVLQGCKSCLIWCNSHGCAGNCIRFGPRQDSSHQCQRSIALCYNLSRNIHPLIDIKDSGKILSYIPLFWSQIDNKCNFDKDFCHFQLHNNHWNHIHILVYWLHHHSIHHQPMTTLDRLCCLLNPRLKVWEWQIQNLFCSVLSKIWIRRQMQRSGHEKQNKPWRDRISWFLLNLDFLHWLSFVFLHLECHKMTQVVSLKNEWYNWETMVRVTVSTYLITYATVSFCKWAKVQLWLNKCST